MPAAAASGTPSATLFESHKDKIYSIALRFTGEEALAMDIAQDTFLKLFSSMADFRGDSSFSTWVYRLVVNSCLDHKRRSWRTIPMADEVMDVLRSPGDALHGLMRAQMSDRVQQAVEKLPARAENRRGPPVYRGAALRGNRRGAGLFTGDRGVAPQSRP